MKSNQQKAMKTCDKWCPIRMDSDAIFRSVDFVCRIGLQPAIQLQPTALFP